MLNESPLYFDAKNQDFDINRLGSYNVPQIFPDELVHGYLARFALQNGLRNLSFTKTEVGYLFIGHPDLRNVSSYLGIIEKITGYPSGYLIRQHTLNHLSRFNQRILSNAFIIDNKLVSKRILKDSIYFCEGCAKEDHQKLGHSYWRISHQLYAIDFCYKHHEWLLQSPQDSVFSVMPHQMMTEYPKSKYIGLAELILNDRIQTYLAITLKYLSERVILDITILHRHLRKKAKTLGLIVSDYTGEISNLPEFLSSVYPKIWLEKYFRKLMCSKDESVKPKHRFGLNSAAKQFNIYSYLLVVSAIDPNIELLDFDLQVELKPSHCVRRKKGPKT